MIEIEALSKSFAGVAAVREVTFSAQAGEIMGVLGPNGAGKTTTMRILCGYLAADSGHARIDGIDVERDSLKTRERIGYLPENVPLYPEMRVAEYLRFRAGIKGVPRSERGGRVANVALRCGVTEILRQTVGTLSKGYRQRVGLADALVADPPILVLDEPTAGLDPNQVVEVRELIRELRGSHTVLLCSHVLSEIEQVCDRVAIFRSGRLIAQDSTEGLRRRLGTGADVTIELAPEPGQIEALLDGIGEIQARETLDDGWLRLTIEAESDPREELFRRATTQGIVLRELTRRQLSLEEIFRELTVGDGSAEPSSLEEES